MNDFDRIAQFYDPALRLAGLIFGGEKRLRKRLLEHADIKRGDKVIDIGCGTGTLALIIAEEAGKEGEVVGIDLSEKMLDIARKKLERSGFHHLTFLRAKAEEIPYPDSYFDKVTVFAVLHEMNHEARINTLREIERVLKIKGKALIVDYDMPHKTGGLILIRCLLGIFEGETARDMLERRIESEIKEAGGLEIIKKKPLFCGAGQILLAEKIR